MGIPLFRRALPSPSFLRPATTLSFIRIAYESQRWALPGTYMIVCVRRTSVRYVFMEDNHISTSEYLVIGRGRGRGTVNGRGSQIREQCISPGPTNYGAFFFSRWKPEGSQNEFQWRSQSVQGEMRGDQQIPNYVSKKLTNPPQ